MGNSTAITITAIIIIIAVIILIRIFIIIITTVIIIRNTIVKIGVFIALSVFFIIKSKFVKLFKLFVEIIIGRLIILISDSITEGISNFYFKIINLYTLIEFIFIEEGSKFIFEIELFYIFNYFKILYFTANFYNKINIIVFSI